MEQSTTVTIQLPPDTEAGDVISFSVDGQEFEFEVPLGSQPGDQFAIQVAGQHTTSSDTVDEATVSIPLASGLELKISSSLPEDLSPEELTAVDSRHYDDSTHRMAWTAGRFLAAFLCNHPRHDLVLELASCRSVIELGSGLGVSGIASAVSPVLPNVDRLVLTDIPAALPLLKHNAKQNRAVYKSGIQIDVGALPWSASPTKEFPSFPASDLIVGSDLLYNTKHISDLVSTIRRHMSEDAKILWAVRWRKPRLERAFFRQLQQTHDWKLLSGKCPLFWDIYGDPNHEKSNLYFSQTMVGVQGKPISLAEITEEHTRTMSTDEYEAWDLSQIQIYLGTPRFESSSQSPDQRRKRNFILEAEAQTSKKPKEDI